MGIKKNEVVERVETVQATTPMVFLGNTIKGVAVKGRVYAELPNELQEWIKKIPQLENFIAPVDRLAEATKDVERLSALWGDIAEIINKEKGD